MSASIQSFRDSRSTNSGMEEVATIKTVADGYEALSNTALVLWATGSCSDVRLEVSRGEPTEKVAFSINQYSYTWGDIDGSTAARDPSWDPVAEELKSAGALVPGISVCGDNDSLVEICAADGRKYPILVPQRNLPQLWNLLDQPDDDDALDPQGFALLVAEAYVQTRAAKRQPSEDWLTKRGERFERYLENLKMAERARFLHVDTKLLGYTYWEMGFKPSPILLEKTLNSLASL
jgi:hypothetical protein